MFPHFRARAVDMTFNPAFSYRWQMAQGRVPPLLRGAAQVGGHETGVAGEKRVPLLLAKGLSPTVPSQGAQVVPLTLGWGEHCDFPSAGPKSEWRKPEVGGAWGSQGDTDAEAGSNGARPGRGPAKECGEPRFISCSF